MNPEQHLGAVHELWHKGSHDDAINSLIDLLRVTLAGQHQPPQDGFLHQINDNLTKLIMKISDATEALNSLSTAADSLSLSNDKLIASTEKLIDALANVSLPADAEAAVTAAQASVETAKAAGAKADAEVTKVDTILPSPAPAGQVPTP